MLPLREIVKEESEDGFKYCNKSHFVLVHGSGGGAWNWYKISTHLEKHGYKVSCLDLKSAGIDATNLSSILTFEDYNKPLVDFLSALPENEKVILVGHSAGGVSVTDAIHRFGKKISIAVFVGATMLRRGFLTEQDKIDGIPDKIRHPHLPTNSTMTREFVPKISPEDATLGRMLQKDGPDKVISEAKFPESPGIDEVLRLYIKTMYDQVLKPEQQDAMIKKWRPSDVFLLESDHNPNLSTPLYLARMLIKAASSTEIFTGTCT
ncbi:Methylesterase [Thalictrum thalictroides]|uniref:Methylesterase n=1 Tax=Thalictrum thalictroides TaxID=46969 RepID=A0A7J6WT48_THATH|nr:Methylesterase [Thalictrum thalictroides]